MPPLTILFLDERCLAVAKPPGLLTVAPPRGEDHGEDTVVARLAREGHPEVLAVHRLDRETSGVVLLARDAEARELLMDLFKGRAISKSYQAIVQGHPNPPAGTLRFPIKDRGKDAVVAPDGLSAATVYRTIERFGRAALLEIDLLTGRHNQIRLHFAHIRHPLVGERKYAFGRDAVLRHKRAALHAAVIAFAPPWGGPPIRVEAPLPLDLENLLTKLREGGGKK